MKNPCPSTARSNRHRWDASSLTFEHRTCRYCGALGKVDKQGVVQFLGSVEVGAFSFTMRSA